MQVYITVPLLEIYKNTMGTGLCCYIFKLHYVVLNTREPHGENNNYSSLQCCLSRVGITYYYRNGIPIKAKFFNC